MKKHAHLFLSYSRDDRKRAKALETALLKSHVRVWRDERNIDPGTKWFEAIEKGIRDARGVVVLATAAAAKSEWVTYEYALASRSSP
jgi:hypothetical protein